MLLCTYAPATPGAMPTKKVCTNAESVMVPLHTTSAPGASLASTRSCAPMRGMRWQSPHQSSPLLYTVMLAMGASACTYCGSSSRSHCGKAAVQGAEEDQKFPSAMEGGYAWSTMLSTARPGGVEA